MAKKQTKQPARLQEALVLHKYILNLFGCKDLEALSRDLKDPALEGVGDERLRVGEQSSGMDHWKVVLIEEEFQKRMFEGN